MTIKELCKRSNDTAVKSGWWEELEALNYEHKELLVGSKLALAHSELSEALEEMRKFGADQLDHVYYTMEKPEKPEGFLIEIADTFVRLADLCAQFSLDLEGALESKMRYNESRPHRHGGKKL